MSTSKPKRIINVNVLPGQPLTGAGKICIHLFVPDEKGSYVEPHTLHRVIDNNGNETRQLKAKRTRGRLACDPKRSAVPVTRKGVTTITPRSDDPRAVTCPKCMNSEYYKSKMNLSAHEESAISIGE